MVEPFVVEIPYLNLISVNKYKIVKGGRPTNKTRPEVEQWMGELADRVRHLELAPPILIKLSGKFKDYRIPDLANLHKVIGDALQEGLRINDQDFFFHDTGVDVGYPNPTLIIEICERR